MTSNGKFHVLARPHVASLGRSCSTLSLLGQGHRFTASGLFSGALLPCETTERVALGFFLSQTRAQLTDGETTSAVCLQEKHFRTEPNTVTFLTQKHSSMLTSGHLRLKREFSQSSVRGRQAFAKPVNHRILVACHSLLKQAWACESTQSARLCLRRWTSTCSDQVLEVPLLNRLRRQHRTQHCSNSRIR